MISQLSTNTASPIVTFLDTRSIPLVNNTTDFQLSIIRFYLDTSTLPVACIAIQPKQSNINLSVNSFTMSYTDPDTSAVYTYQQYLQYIPQDLSATTPKAPSANSPYYFQDNTTGYYYVYNYQYFVNLVNNTFQQALDGLNNLLTNAGLTIISDVTPYMTFDTVTSLCTIVYDVASYGTNESGLINIYFNQSLYELFSSFTSIIYGYAATQGKNFQLQLISDNGISAQEYASIGSWNPILSIVFTSGSLPIIPNQISLPAIFYDGKIINNSSTANIVNVITDLIATNNQYKPFIEYNPSAQYRYIALNPNQQIRHIDISVFWMNRFGEYIPVRLPTNGSCTMKLLFSRKTMLQY